MLAQQSAPPLKPVPIMIHHGLRDTHVRPQGCCDSSHCCCSITAEHCVSVASFWAKWGHVNGCTPPATGSPEAGLLEVLSVTNGGAQLVCRH